MSHTAPLKRLFLCPSVKLKLIYFKNEELAVNGGKTEICCYYKLFFFDFCGPSNNAALSFYERETTADLQYLLDLYGLQGDDHLFYYWRLLTHICNKYSH